MTIRLIVRMVVLGLKPLACATGCDGGTGEGIEIDGLLDDVLGKPLAEALVGCDLDLLENVTYHCCLILIFKFLF